MGPGMAQFRGALRSAICDPWTRDHGLSAKMCSFATLSRTPGKCPSYFARAAAQERNAPEGASQSSWTHRSAKSEQCPLPWPVQRNARLPKQSSGTKVDRLATIENRRDDVGCPDRGCDRLRRYHRCAPDHVAVAKLAIDCEVKECSITQPTVLIEPETDCPHLRGLRARFAPRTRPSFHGRSS